MSVSFLSRIIPPCCFFFHTSISSSSKGWERGLKKRAKHHCLDTCTAAGVPAWCLMSSGKQWCFMGSRTWFPWGDPLGVLLWKIPWCGWCDFTTIPSWLVFGNTSYRLAEWHLLMLADHSWGRNQLCFIVSIKPKENPPIFAIPISGNKDCLKVTHSSPT